MLSQKQNEVPLSSPDTDVQSPSQKDTQPMLTSQSMVSHVKGFPRRTPTRQVSSLPPDHDELVDICFCPFMRPFASIIGHGRFVSNIYNLASATLGAGIVTVPAGFYDSGIVVSSLLLAVVCACTIYSIRLLVETKEITGLRSYEEMAHSLLGKGWDYLTAFLMFVFCWGVCVGYVISTGDIISTMLNEKNTPALFKTDEGLKLLIALVWLVGMLPLSLPKQINSLRYVSFVGVMFIVFFVICVIIHYSQNPEKPSMKDLNMFNTGINAVNGLNLYIFAFICQVNVFEIYEEMHKPTVSRMTRDSAISMSLVAILNFLSGFFGYCDFGQKVSGSLLLMYRPFESVLFMISYIGICIKLCVGFAICIQPSRDAIYYCLGWSKTSEVATRTNILISGFLALTALICGLLLPDIVFLFSMLGGICGGALGFLLPAFFYLYTGHFTQKMLSRKSFILNYFGCLVLIIGGVVAVIFGTSAALYSKIEG